MEESDIADGEKAKPKAQLNTEKQNSVQPSRPNLLKSVKEIDEDLGEQGPYEEKKENGGGKKSQLNKHQIEEEKSN